MHPSRFTPVKTLAGIAILALAGTSAHANILLNENFDSDTNGAVPTGWKDVVNFTTSSTTNSTNKISGATPSPGPSLAYRLTITQRVQALDTLRPSSPQ